MAHLDRREGLRLAVAGLLAFVAGAREAWGQEPMPILINTGFEGASLGTVEKLGGARFRLHVQGQYDERGRNRQASWFYFRMDHVRGRELELTLTDLVGEYNDKPGAVAFGQDIVPVWSADGRHWQHFERHEWDDTAKEATLRLRPESDRIWIAHQPPYTHSDLRRLLAEVEASPFARVEVIGKTVQGRDLHLATVTDFDTPDAGKKTLWLQARQHAWESGTSYVLEGALRFLVSDDPRAAEIRRRCVFKLQPMGDPDGSANGKVRFNANGFDVNRHWDEVDLRRKELLERMPEIWYVKKALLAQMRSGQPIDLMVNLHNTETGEYVDGTIDEPALQARVRAFYEALRTKTDFDPSRAPAFSDGKGSTTSMWTEARIPSLLMEQRIGTSKKLGRRPTVEDRLRYGGQLAREMAAAGLTP